MGTCQLLFGVFMSTFGDRLKEERERLRLNQTALGELGGVRKQAQLHYESGKRFPDANYLAAVAGAGVDVVYALTGERATNAAATPMEVALLDNYRNSAAEVRIGVSRLLAETGRAMDRANAPSLYLPPTAGLNHGTQSNAVHNDVIDLDQGLDE